MRILSPAFLLFGLIAIAAWRLHGHKHYRVAVLTALNAYFLWSYAPNPLALVPLALFVVQGYLLVRLMQTWPRRWLLLVSVTAYVLLFAHLRRYALVSGLMPLPGPYVTVGLSYILFRALHVMIDAQSGLPVERLGLVRWFNYTCGFLSFVSGPIQRYEDFVAQEEHAGRTPLDVPELHEGLSRISHGLVKLTLVEFFVRDAHRRSVVLIEKMLSGKTTSSQLPLWVIVAAACFAFTVYLYVNFSGYMDVVIGLGRLMGFDLPENFDKPFLATSFLELWSRWHITLSEWFKTYTFNPIVTSLARKYPKPTLMPYFGVLGFLVAFFVMGVWHGTSKLFLFYGLFLGLGVSGNKLYEVLLRKKLGKKRHRALMKHKLYCAVTNGMTIAYFAAALVCFWRPWKELVAMVVGLGALGTALVMVVLLVSSIAIMSLLRLGSLVATKLPLERIAANLFAQRTYMGLKVFWLLLYFALSASDAPPFVYEEF